MGILFRILLYDRKIRKKRRRRFLSEEKEADPKEILGGLFVLL